MSVTVNEINKKKNQVTTWYGISSINAIWSKCNITPNIYLYRPICRFFISLQTLANFFQWTPKNYLLRIKRTVKVNSRKYLNLTYSTIQNNQEVEDSISGCKVRACVRFFFFFPEFFRLVFLFLFFFPGRLPRLRMFVKLPNVLQRTAVVFFLSFEGRHTVRFTVEGRGVSSTEKDILCSGAEWALVRRRRRRRRTQAKNKHGGK